VTGNTKCFRGEHIYVYHCSISIWPLALLAKAKFLVQFQLQLNNTSKLKYHCLEHRLQHIVQPFQQPAVTDMQPLLGHLTDHLMVGVYKVKGQ